MALVPAICTQCGAQIEVDDTHEAGICKFCGTAFITEKAINNYVINNTIHVQNASINVTNVNIDNLVLRAKEFEELGEKNKALEYYNKVLDEDINNSEARAGIERINYLSEINIGGIIVPKEIGERLKSLVDRGEIVQAIKELREATGLGLKESKDAIDAYRSTNTNNVVKTSISNNTVERNTISSNNASKSSGGCYIATSVYGSYDCPEVWTLRRFRDYTLDATWYGRLFIKCYYAISPTIVRWFGEIKWFKTFWKARLDKMVYKLNSNGFENTRYQDKY